MKRICTALVAVLAIASSSAAKAPAPKPAVVKSIAFVTSGAGLEISILITGVFSHNSFVLSSPNRLVIDISPAERLVARPTYSVQAGGVTTVRTGQFKRRVSRVIVDFSGPIPAYDIQKTASGLVVKVSAAPAAETIAPPAVSPEPVKKEKPAEEAKPVPPAEVRTPAAKPARPAARPTAPARPAAEPAARPVFYNTTVGVMAGTYKNDSARFGEVYGSGTSIQFGLNLSRSLVHYGDFQLDATAEARLISKTGQSTLSGKEAKITIYPLSLGARLLYQTKYVIPFVGYGADWFSYKESSALYDTSGSASGDHLQAGLYVVIPGRENLRIKVYYKYTRVTATENEIEVELGGPEFGIGVSFGFNVLNGAVLDF